MRPLRLELRGFTAFRNETVVDFEGRHLFAITGPTGAGKSSLLDAITWALYGRVPRVGREAKQLVSQGAQVMAVRFDFRAHGETYRVVRQIGKSTAFRLERLVAADVWHPVADKAADVAAEVERIIGLDYETFTKTVLLPQGAFDAFLRGEPGQRKDILSSLLGLGVYERMREQAFARTVAARSRAAEQRQRADALGDATPEAIAAIKGERGALAERLTTVQQQRARHTLLVSFEREASERSRDAAAAVAAAESAQQAAQQASEALAAAETTLAEATAQLARIDAERTALGYDAERHRALEQQASLLVQRQQARADLEQAEAKLADARERCEQARAAATEAAAGAQQQRSALATATKTLDGARAGAASAAGSALAAVALLRESHARVEAERAEAERCVAASEERGRLLDALAKQAADVAGDLEQRDADVQRATAAAAVAEAERVRAASAVEAATSALADAADARERAARDHAAADLRRGLAVGDPCPVCGEPIASLAEHDAPDLDAAFEAVEAAERTLQAARGALEARVRAASAEHARVEAAQAALDAAQARRASVEAECASAGVALAAIGEERERTAAALAATKASVLDATRRASAVVERERALSLLIATVPADVAPAEAPGVDDGLDVEQVLRDALEVLSTATSSSRDAETAAREAEEAARAASAAATHAEELASAAAKAAEDARTRLASLATPEDEDAEALLEALTAATQQARRHAELDQAARAAEQQRAAATSRLDERRASVAAAQAEAATRAEAATAAGALAQVAAEAYAAEWRTLPGVEAAPDAELLARWGERIGRDEVQVATEHALAEQRLAQAHAHAAEAEQLRAEAAAQEQTMAVAQGLEQDLHKNHFIAFVQREAMQILAAEAAERMEHLSRGRYRMRADGDEFVVIDRLNGDEQRSVKTLSGGETFLASLALALALAERLPQLAGHGGALSLESLFLDEGFGTLDADALDVAIEALELLAGDSRMIGVISHVPLVAERLPDRIEVLRAGGSSTVR